MPLGNWVMLDSGIPERVHLIDHALVEKEITDPDTGRPAVRKSCVFDVDRLNGEPVTAQLSVMAEKLFASLEPYLPGKAYRDYEFVITKTGARYRTSYSVQVIPLKK